jgi:translation initiation factor 1 (eIF-1/SUI1)
LKTTLSRGGSIKANSLEFQGDVKEELKKLLLELGFGFK